MIEFGNIGDKHLSEICFMHNKPPFLDDKKGLNTYKSMSFIVSKGLLIGGKKKDVERQKKENKFWEGKERENECSDFGEGDAP